MDLLLKDVAELLRVSQSTLKRWVDEGRVPAYRLHDQYRFSRMEIEDWLLRQKLEEAPGLQIQEGAGDLQFSLFRALLRGDVMASVPASSKEQLIASCMHVMAQKFGLDAGVLTDLLIDRENMMSTGLGHGIAVPHTRDFLLNTHFDIVLTVYPEKPLDYASLDGQPVHTCFFLFACDDRRHLNLLSRIAHFCHAEQTRAFLQTQPSKERLLTHVKDWESRCLQKS